MGLGDYFGDYNENFNLNAYALLCALEELVILLAQVLNNGCLIDIYHNLIGGKRL